MGKILYCWIEHTIGIKKTILNTSYVRIVWVEMIVHLARKDSYKVAIWNFFKKELLKYANMQASKYCNLLDVKFNTICVKMQKTRWGSCSSKWNLNFNIRIMMAPCEVIDYLIAHEVAHLKHMNHSVLFWQTVENLQSNYREAQKWLKMNWNTLML